MSVNLQKPPPLYRQTVAATGINPLAFIMPSTMEGCTNVKYRKITKEVWEGLK